MIEPHVGLHGGSVAVTCLRVSKEMLMFHLKETQRGGYFCHGLHGVRKPFVCGVLRHYWGHKRRLESIDVFVFFAACCV